MSADVLSEDLKSRLHLTTKTVGQDRIRRARENNEDVAILSMFLPNATAERENKKFCCALREQCLLGDPRKTIAGVVFSTKFDNKLDNGFCDSDSNFVVIFFYITTLIQGTLLWNY